jgi:hypothetical protein
MSLRQAGLRGHRNYFNCKITSPGGNEKGLLVVQEALFITGSFDRQSPGSVGVFLFAAKERQGPRYKLQKPITIRNKTISNSKKIMVEGLECIF